MYIAITRVPPEKACANCGSRNILIHSIYRDRLYGEYCSYDCQKTTCGTETHDCVAQRSQAQRSQAHVTGAAVSGTATPPIVSNTVSVYSSARIV